MMFYDDVFIRPRGTDDLSDVTPDAGLCIMYHRIVEDYVETGKKQDA